MSIMQKLEELRRQDGKVRTPGLADAVIERFAAQYPELVEAVDDAVAAFRQLREEFSELLALDENEQIARVQADFVNFYAEDAVNPYVALAARGPWVVTLKGAVVHDSGGYGMLGFGHAPRPVLAALARPQVMANIMTPSVSQMRFARALKRNTDVNAKLMTEPGSRHAGRTIKRLAVKGAFHGRTERPAIYSDSSRKPYVQHLASFRDEHSLITVEPYKVEQLRQIFADADRNGWFIEAMFLEPVMGEGDPGRSVTPEFYAAARELTRAHGSLFFVDSIQAGLRAHGVLSIVDYPAFEQLDPPDMETYSKALNAGQYPLSVLAVTERTAALYKKGIYGNTMTANPRAMEVAVAVLEQFTPEVRNNIRVRGKEFLDKLNKLKNELPGLITKVQGTGLLFSCELAPQFKCYGANSTEEWLRERGLGVIHGGVNSLRFTPHFAVTAAEADLVIDGVRQALLHGPRKEQAAAA